ncbi:hypothetical protein BKA83DRAFT_4123288 [Pisolithus microcarpus]|nr:hypothetical protein BKA83DRAFT_4123288 [Pisolithus microcarpus]
MQLRTHRLAALFLSKFLSGIVRTFTSSRTLAILGHLSASTLCGPGRAPTGRFHFVKIMPIAVTPLKDPVLRHRRYYPGTRPSKISAKWFRNESLSTFRVPVNRRKVSNPYLSLGNPGPTCRRHKTRQLRYPVNSLRHTGTTRSVVEVLVSPDVGRHSSSENAKSAATSTANNN